MGEESLPRGGKCIYNGRKEAVANVLERRTEYE